jgi:hypothetical protein
MIRRLSLALLALFSIGPALAETPDDFAASAPITLDGTGPYYRIALPIEAVLASRFLDLRDLRVYNGHAEPVPFGLLRQPPATEEATVETKLAWFPLYAADAKAETPEVKVERRPDGTVVSVRSGDAGPAPAETLRGYLFDLSQVKDSPRKLELDWDPSVTGLQEVSVDASDDLEQWHNWKAAAELARFDFNGQQIERRQIELPGGSARYLRLTWRTPRLAPRLTAASLTSGSITTRPAAILWTEPALPEPAGDAAYEWRLPHPIAVEQLRITLPQVNSLAPAELSGRDETVQGNGWQFLARASLYRLAVDGRETTQPDISVPPRPFTAIRLTVDPRAGGIGAGKPTLAFGLPARTLLFLARGDGPFRLAIGNPQAKSADLPPTTLIPGWGSANAPPVATASLGAVERRAPADQPTAASWPVDWKTLILWAILVAGIAAIATMAVHLLRQVKR